MKQEQGVYRFSRMQFYFLAITLNMEKENYIFIKT